MEIVAIVISITSMLTSVYLVRKFSDPIRVDVTVNVPEIRVASEESLVEEPVQIKPVKDESHLAWRNEKNIPVSGPASKAPGGPPPSSGPQQRPAGFYR